ncbi:hypothetical protein NUACC21_25900 [Scytonema sp. NUACC21]
MIPKILVTFGALLFIVELSPTAHAQTVMGSRSQSRNVTLSGDSLRGVQSRSIRELYPNSTSQTSSATQNQGNLTPRSLQPNQQSVELEDRLDLVFEENSRKTTVLNPILTELAGDRDQRLRVQYQLTED